MKLFLSSVSLSYEQLVALTEMTGKEVSKVKVALIENASDVYGENEKRDWAYASRDNFTAFGFGVDVVDLEDYRLGAKRLLEQLESADIIWIAGGNTYYLRWLLQETRADTIITGLVRRGKIYGGDSAGAVVAGPTLDHFQAMDDPAKAPSIILDGLKLTDRVIVPHWNNEKFNARRAVYDNLVDDGYRVVRLQDGQDFVVTQ